MEEPIIKVGIGEFDELNFAPTADGNIVINDVEIGKQFHWNKRENQRFNGTFSVKVVGGKVLLINHIPLEKYITSVISSEMSGECPIELLKAHAIISRSWLMAQISGKKPEGKPIITDDEICTWYDREAHDLFDVCADDHCQRYQGITKTYNPTVGKAVAETRGIFLTYNGEVCDARFSKCCGGKSETFENCWQPVHYNYLESVDCPYCNTDDAALLKTILNDYDQQSKDFYSWTATLNQGTLQELLKTKTSIDFGEIIDIEPLERGASGRITRLKIVGEKCTKIFGKELEIRRILSQTHLYSSWFDVEKTSGGTFVLHGRGWGHGVGMCQIGAAVMASKGHKYDEILRYYYKNVMIEKLY